MTGKVDPPFALAGRRVWVAGHRGMVGSAIVRGLAGEDCEIVTVGRAEVDLTRQQAVEDWMAEARPEVVFLAAAKVGGILVNDTHPAEFIYENLAIETNVIHTAWRTGVTKLVLLGSSCIYPKLAPQPMSEEALLTGALEPTNQWYAVAKIAGIKMCQAYRRQYGCDFISAMPTNLYGPGDNFDLMSSHVVPALINKIHRAKIEGANSVEVWGSGEPRREFLYVDDAAGAMIHLVQHYSGEDHVNVGTGADVTIRELAETIAEVVCFAGGFEFDRSKPDGTPRKLLDTRRLGQLGWTSAVGLRDGLARAYDWYVSNIAEAA